MEQIFNFITFSLLLAIFVALFKLFFDKKSYKYFLPVFSVLVLALCNDISDTKFHIVYFLLFILSIAAIFVFLKYGFISDSAIYEKHLSFLTMLFFIYYLILIFKTAWISDDAYITFRVADNFVNGYGLRWNIEDRVQVFTNTLFLFVFIPFLV